MQRSIFEIILQFGPLVFWPLAGSFLLFLVFMGRSLLGAPKTALHIGSWIAIPGLLIWTILYSRGALKTAGIDADSARGYAREDILVLTAILTLFLLGMLAAQVATKRIGK